MMTGPTLPTVLGRTFEKVLLVRNPDINAGFCALITYALNGVRLALKNGWLPVVKFDEATCPHFFDADRGDNVWEYYFAPVHGISSRELDDLIEAGALDPNRVHEYDPWLLMDLHHSDPDRIATFWAKDVPDRPSDWMAEKRQIGRRYAAEYLSVKPHISERVDAFVDTHMKGAFTFAAHVRGTDFAYAEPTPPEAYFREIERVASERNVDSYRVFLATDQSQFVDRFRAEYGDALLTYDALRSSDDVAPFRFSGVSPYKKGEDVLIDTLLMSRSDYLLKCAAAGGEYALWFNADLQCTDFGLGSRFDTRKYHMLESAYLKLNVDDLSSPRRRLMRAYGIVVQYLRTLDYLALPRRVWRFGRRLLGVPRRP